MYTTRLNAVLHRETGRHYLVVKFSDPAAESRLTNSTSDGELALVGTAGVVSESLGKTRYMSTSTLVMLAVGAMFAGSRPVKVAELIEVCWVIAKLSPVSVSPVPGRDVVAHFAEGFRC